MYVRTQYVVHVMCFMCYYWVPPSQGGRWGWALMLAAGVQYVFLDDGLCCACRCEWWSCGGVVRDGNGVGLDWRWTQNKCEEERSTMIFTMLFSLRFVARVPFERVYIAVWR